MVLFYPFSMERIGLSGVGCGARVGGRRKSERDAMWISLFTLVCGVAVCLSGAAVMMERGGLQLLRRETSKHGGTRGPGGPRAPPRILGGKLFTRVSPGRTREKAARRAAFDSGHTTTV